MVAPAPIKTDATGATGATVLAKLHASPFLPGAWGPDPKTLARRRQATRRTQVVRQRARLRTVVRPTLHAHLPPRCPHADLSGSRGRAWLPAQDLPPDGRDAAERHLREYDRLGGGRRGWSARGPAMPGPVPASSGW